MFTKLKLKSLRKRILKNLEKRDRSQLHSQVNSIAFVVHEQDFSNIETLYSIASSLGIEKENCQVLAFQKYQKNVPLKDHQVHHKQIKWKGVIDNENANHFLKQPFDVLIGFYNGEDTYLDFLISESMARFKVGLALSNVKLFDLQIQLKISENKKLATELNKYLQVLGKVS